MTFVSAASALALGQNWRLQCVGHDRVICIFDVAIAAFGLDSDARHIAVLIKADPGRQISDPKAKRTKGASDSEEGAHTLRVYGFDAQESELTDLKGSLDGLGRARVILFSPCGGFLSLFDPPSSRVTVVRVATTASSVKLSMIASDVGATPLFYPHPNGVWFALFNDRRQIADFWNLDTDKVVHALPLSRRGTRVVDSIAVGNVMFTIYDNQTIGTTLWDEKEKKFVKLKQLDDLFPIENDNSKVHKLATKLRAHKMSGATDDRYVIGLSNSRYVHIVEVTETAARVAASGSLPLAVVLCALYENDASEGDSQVVALIEVSAREFSLLRVELTSAAVSSPLILASPPKELKKEKAVSEALDTISAADSTSTPKPQNVRREHESEPKQSSRTSSEKKSTSLISIALMGAVAAGGCLLLISWGRKRR